MIKYFQWEQSKIISFNIAYFLSLLSLFLIIAFCLKLILVSTDINPILFVLNLHVKYSVEAYHVHLYWKYRQVLLYLHMFSHADSWFCSSQNKYISKFYSDTESFNHIYAIFQNLSIFLGPKVNKYVNSSLLIQISVIGSLQCESANITCM